MLHAVADKTWHQDQWPYALLTDASEGRYAIYPRDGLRIVVQLWVPDLEEEQETFDLFQIHEYPDE